MNEVNLKFNLFKVAITGKHVFRCNIRLAFPAYIFTGLTRFEHFVLRSVNIHECMNNFINII